MAYIGGGDCITETFGRICIIIAKLKQINYRVCKFWGLKNVNCRSLKYHRVVISRRWGHLLINWLYLLDLSSFSLGIPILIIQVCQTYSQFHRCSSLIQIWQRAFAHFLIPPEEQHLVDPKQNFHTPGLDAPVLCKLPPFRLSWLPHNLIKEKLT